MFDATGDRLVVLGGDRTVQLWDIPSTRPVRPPIPAPTVTGLVGFAADGHLVATQRDDESTLADIRLAFVDLGAGRRPGR
ncbi:hypothetical protein BJF90_28665 [Pseudonocardia sp. CNS-004]|nr:hypothetical protein BJF90_28665 [Pseudonocardia sp. CNS-004]